MRERLRAAWQALRGGPAPDPRVLAFRAAVHEATRGPLDRDRLAALAGEPARLGVADDEVELELEILQGARDVLALEDQVAARGLPELPSQHKALNGERCRFAASASIAGADGDRPGRLLLTDRRLVFLASPLVAVPWSGVRRVAAEGRDLVVAAHGQPAGWRFRCNSYADARCGRWLADRLRGAPSPAP